MPSSNPIESAESRSSVKEFFEQVPPGTLVKAKDLCHDVGGENYYSYELKIPPIQLYCGTGSCEGIRFFDIVKAPEVDLETDPEQSKQHFLTFTCRNCKISEKTYAFTSSIDADRKNSTLLKYGEQPPFGPHTPTRFITLIGAEREYFLKGRRSENQGLGIAAFAYYRRVVENQKARIFDEIIRVAEKVGASRETIDDLKVARSETQFSKAVGAIKHGVPESLLINGHNPLTLLHSALSEGLHAQSDEDCLELATSIRILLTELVERMATALKEEETLNNAVKRLLTASAAKAERKT